MPIVELVTGAMLPACVWQDVYVNEYPMSLAHTKYIVQSQAGGLFMANYVQDGSAHVRVLGALFKLIVAVRLRTNCVIRPCTILIRSHSLTNTYDSESALRMG